MAKAKIQTVPTAKSVDTYFDKVEPETKRDDCRAISKMMTDISEEPPTMWGPGIVGFGSRVYKYETGRSGDMPLVAFAGRKQNIVLYLMGIVEHFPMQLKKLGKYKTGVGCIYINKLDDVDTGVLKQLIKTSLEWGKAQTKDLSRRAKKLKVKS